MKKGTIGLEQVILAILSLLVAAGIIHIAINLTGGPAQYLLGLGNISAFDQDIVERYEATRNMEADVIDSTEALVYSINRLAVLDTYSQTTNMPLENVMKLVAGNPAAFDKYNAEFGGTKVQWSIMDGISIRLEPTHELRDFVRKIVNCKRMADDKQENINCYNIQTKELQGTIEKDAVINDMAAYYNEPECDDVCKKTVESLLGKKPDTEWYNPLQHVRNTFNLKNFEWKLDSEKIDKAKYPLIRICWDRYRVDAVTVTANPSDCDPKNTKDKPFGFAVLNFNLPQTIEKSDNPLIWGVEQWLNAYGDPKYLLYYEKFPEGEDAYWQASAYNVAVGAAITTEGFFLLLDAVPFGGSVIKTMIKKVIGVKVIEEFIQKFLKRPAKIGLNFVKDVVGGIGDFIRDKAGGKYVKEAAEKAVTEIGEIMVRPAKIGLTKLVKTQLVGDYVENVAKKTVRERLKKALGNSFGNLDETTIKNVEEAYVRAFKDARSKFGDNIIDNGKISKDAIMYLDNEFDTIFTVVKQGNLPEDRIKVKAYEILEKRMDSSFVTDPVYGKDAIDNLLKSREIEPGSDAAQKFMEQWDYEHAEGLLIKEHNDVIESLRRAAGDDYDNAVKSLRDGMKTSLGDATLRVIPRGLTHMFKIATEAKDTLRRLVTSANDKEREEVLNELVEHTKYLEQMGKSHPAELRRFLMDKKKTVDLLWDEGAGKVRWDIDEVNSNTRDKLTKNLDTFLEKHTDLEARFTAQIQEKTLKGIMKKRHLVTAAAVYSAIWLNSIQAKHVSVGTNAIGLRTPFEATQDYSELEINDPAYSSNPLNYLEKTYFPSYLDEDKRDESVLGLLPEVNKYYMSLIRDKEKFWFDQSPIKFYLASPCRADLYLRVSRCECYGDEEKNTIGQSKIPLIGSLFEHEGIYQTGQRHELKDGTSLDYDFDPKDNDPKDNDEMLYKLDEQNKPIKYCKPSGAWYKFGETLRTPKCIKINPVMADVDKEEYNYCYHGSGGADDTVINAGLNFVLPVGASVAGVLCGPGAPVCVPVFGAIGGVVGTLTYSWYNTGHQWPNHD